jgi:hypothetical protein
LGFAKKDVLRFVVVQDEHQEVSAFLVEILVPTFIGAGSSGLILNPLIRRHLGFFVFILGFLNIIWASHSSSLHPL